MILRLADASLTTGARSRFDDRINRLSTIAGQGDKEIILRTASPIGFVVNVE